MKRPIDLYDVQGNICKAYGRYGYPVARYLFLEFHDTHKAREFVHKLIPYITRADRWPLGSSGELQKPDATTNIAFTYMGLIALGLPQRSLSGFPDEFKTGMKSRAALLGDDGPSALEHWDPIWQGERVHAWMSINAKDSAKLEQRFALIQQMITDSDAGVALRTGHRGENGSLKAWQDAATLKDAEGNLTGKEHFGFVDGIGNPVIEGFDFDPDKIPERACGNGKLAAIYHINWPFKFWLKRYQWQPLATGEFLLGHIDEAKEYPPAPTPHLLARNGTYMVYRKLHENVATFHDYVEQTSQGFNGSTELFKAKMAGRWPDNGAPIVIAPTDAEKAKLDAKMAKLTQRAQAGCPAAAQELRELKLQWTNFTYEGDQSGAKCPVGAHIRRSNTRGSLDEEKLAFETPSALDDRRRILRRGLPYGAKRSDNNDKTEQGIIFMSINASLERQFEFVQQQWMNYSNDFRLGNDRDPFIGSNNGKLTDKHIIQGHNGNDGTAATAPHLCSHLPRFVETRGGDYFFIPSLTALDMIAQGIIDPT